MRAPITFDETGGPNSIYLSTFNEWLSQQPFTPGTARVYYSRVRQFLAFLDHTDMAEKPLASAEDMQIAVVAYLNFLRQAKRTSDTINANLNAFKSFCDFLGIEQVQFEREVCPPTSARILTTSEQENFLLAVEQQKSMRDRALARVLFYSGLRLGDCMRLNVDNVTPGATSILVRPRTGIYLDQETRRALNEWLEERQQLRTASSEPALWLTQKGRRLSLPGAASVIDRIAWEAGLATVSAETLRRTALTRASDCHSQHELAAMYGGYVGKSTIKRYSTSLSIGAIE